MHFNSLLRSRYIAAFEATEASFLYALRSFSGQSTSRLNDAFLPTVTAGYSEAALKVMVVGRETRAWRYSKPAANARVASSADISAELSALGSSVADYVDRGMKTHADFLAECLAKSRHKSGLVRLLKEVARVTGSEGLVYSNLFSVAIGGKDPRRDPQAWPVIRGLSQALMNVQIDVLQPDVIVFANGSSSAGERRAFFPHEGDDAAQIRCTNPHDWKSTHKIPVAHLFGFTLDTRVQCYRIQHPSSPAHRTHAKAAREHLFKLLRERQGGGASPAADSRAASCHDSA